MLLGTGFLILDPSLTAIPKTSWKQAGAALLLTILLARWRVCGVSSLLCRQYFVKGTRFIIWRSANSSIGLELVFASVHEICRSLIGYLTIQKSPGTFQCINGHFHGGVWGNLSVGIVTKIAISGTKNAIGEAHSWGCKSVSFETQNQ